jgi:uncharacterized lipoprotein YehR (DUF1307 family)
MKKYISLLIVVLACSMLFAGCNAKEETPTQTTEKIVYAFMDVAWTRDAENDIETIRFGSDGHFTYYCACGNPVNDSDLCEGYTYDDSTKTITLDCFEVTDEMVTVIKIVKCDDQELHLDFDGDVRIFTK